MTAPHLKIASEANAIAMRVKAGDRTALLSAIWLADWAWDEIGKGHPLTVAVCSFVAKASPAKRNPARMSELADELQRAVLTVLQPAAVDAGRADIHG